MDVTARLPATIMSAIGSCSFSRWARQWGEAGRHLTVALLCALPLWSEFTPSHEGTDSSFSRAPGPSACLAFAQWDLEAEEVPVLRSLFAAHLSRSPRISSFYFSPRVRVTSASAGRAGPR